MQENSPDSSDSASDKQLLQDLQLICTRGIPIRLCCLKILPENLATSIPHNPIFESKDCPRDSHSP